MATSTRDTRYQAAVVDAGRLLLLRCVPHGEAGFWVLPGGGREAGESAEACVCRITRGEPAPGGGEGWAALTAVRWLALGEPASWEPALRVDPFLYPQLIRIGAALQRLAAPAAQPEPNEAV